MRQDAKLTTFMNRVVAGLTLGEWSAPSRLVPSVRRPLAQAVHDWSEIRGRAEHVVSEANSMLPGSVERLALIDDVAGLGFLVRCGRAWVRVSLGRDGKQGWLEFQRSWADSTHLEPEDPTVMEDLVIALIAG